MDNKEFEILQAIQETMNTKWYQYFMDFISDEISACKETVIEWVVPNGNECIYNYYDIVRSEIKYLQGLRDRLEVMKKSMWDINDYSVEDEV